MTDKLAIIYDTANVLHRIANNIIEPENIYYPLLIPGPNITIGIMPIFKKDLSKLKGADCFLEKIKNIDKKMLSKLPIPKETKYFEIFNPNFFMLKLRNLRIESGDGDGDEIATLTPKGRIISTLFMKNDIKMRRLTKEERNELSKLVEKSSKCKNASIEEVLKDMEYYIFPFVKLLKEHKYSILLISSDQCFLEIAKEKEEVEILQTEDLKDLIKVLEKIKQILN
ncbi:MAG: hypothetical protein QXJ72_08230 [Thermoproteota archaeon]